MSSSKSRSNREKAPSRKAGCASNGGEAISGNNPTRVKAPVAQGNKRRMARPKIKNQGAPGDVRVRHREYISDTFGAVGFEARQHSINPGLAWEFPWLSKLAQRFESYRFNKLKYVYETSSPTSATGTVMIVMDYDPSDPAPTDKTQALNYRDAARSPPWCDIAISATKEDLHKRQSYFVRSGATNNDLRLSDVGNMFLCVQGQAGSTVIGELYVEYDVSLMTPQIGDVGWDHAVWGEFTGNSNSDPFGTVGGQLPVTSSSTGTTTSVTTFIFTGPWEGFVTAVIGGTALTDITFGGTASSTVRGEVINSAGTGLMSACELKALVGQTFTVTLANTTITAARLMFGQGDPV